MHNMSESSVHREAVIIGGTACWGVYCDDGPSGRIGVAMKELIARGQERTAQAIYDLSAKCEKGNHKAYDTFIFAGDNVYPNLLGEPVKKESDGKVKYTFPHDFELQFLEGFIKCYKKAREFMPLCLMASGNHDIDYETEQFTKSNTHPDSGWYMPHFFYSKLLRTDGGMTVNIMVMNTNVYDKKYISKCGYEGGPKKLRVDQNAFITNTIKENLHGWNILVGHIPIYFCAHGKEGKQTTGIECPENVNDDLAQDITEIMVATKCGIDVYVCGDEHNQQYIRALDKTRVRKGGVETKFNLPPQVVCGSGGTKLDEHLCMLESGIQNDILYSRPTFGFFRMVISQEKIALSFWSAPLSQGVARFVIPRRVRGG